MDLSNISQTFQKINVFQAGGLIAAGKQSAAQATAPGSMLQQISDQTIDRQQGIADADAAAKTKEIKMDAYDKADAAQSLEGKPSEVLEYYLHVTKIFATSAGRQEQELLDFKERLQGMDETIQSYQDILAGKSALPQGLNAEDVSQLLSKATQSREQLVKDGVERLNQWSDYFVTSDNFDKHMQTVLGENPFAGAESSEWRLDAAGSDIYSEIDRVLNNTHRVTETLDRGVRQIYDALESRGSGDKYKQYLESWRWERGSYFDRTEAKDIRQLIQENLMRGPLQAL